jgi:8-amino-7-oxononanoate synthase
VSAPAPGPAACGWLAGLQAQATARQRAGLRRELRPRTADDGLVDLAGNDYLGLSRHPEVVAAAAAALKAYGVGATASRLVRGSTDVHATLECALAQLLECEAALVYSSGYLANLGAVRAVAMSPVGGALVASDAHNHASLVDGCRLAGRDGARTVVYAHADVEALDAALDGAAAAVALTESVFSVHGDLAPLPALHAVTRRRGAILVVDDAHGLGVLGAGGGGAAAAAGLSGQPDVVVTATLSKALGGAGGVVAGPRALVQHLVETSRTFIFDTGLPPALAAGALAAVALIRGPAGSAARDELGQRAASACRRLREAGLEVGEPAAGVLSVAAPGPDEAVAWAADCRAHGVAVGCFRPPSTPDGLSRLRLTVNAGIPREDFDRAVATVLATVPRSPRS